MLLNASCRDAHSAIQDALDHSVQGDTVLVGPGTYYEHLVITKSGIHLLGSADTEGEPVSILQDMFERPDQIAIISAGSVEIANFLLRRISRDDAPVGLYNTNSNKVHHLTIYMQAAPQSEAGLSPYGIAAVDEWGNEFYSTLIWDTARPSENHPSVELLTSKLDRVKHHIQTRAKSHD